MINNRYIIERLIGEGRSKVFLCRDTELDGKKLAIKILSDPNAEPDEKNNFREEYYILKRLNHPNIIQVYELGCVITSDDEEISYGCYFFTMDYFSGKSINDVKIDLDKINTVITQICSVLFYLHQSNYIYYDLKPENILIDTQHEAPTLKFIDFGLAEHLPDTKKYQPKGTAQYIAPEILKKQPHDFRVDIYSLGILLYKLVYSRYPFQLGNELQIYKAHLESDFDFPEFDFNNKLSGVLKKTLAKDPAERYDSVLKILIDLDIPITKALTKDFIPPKIFTNRRDVLAMLKKYISDDSSHEVFSIRGYESMGKTFLAEELTRIYNEVILISESHTLRGIEFIRSVFRKILYHENTHKKITEHTFKDLKEFVVEKEQHTIEKLRRLFHQLVSEANFILVLDGFNIYDEVSQALFRELIPILQVNGKKIILTEESELDYTSESLNNLREINISPFTDTNLTEYLTQSFYSFYPIEELRKLILRYADLLPGSIEGFVKDIHLFGVIDYKTGHPLLETNEDTIELLKSSHNEIYEARLKTLDEQETELVQIMSLFEFPVNVEILKGLTVNKSFDENQVLSSLEKKNILQHSQFNREPVFSASGLKKYIYGTIKNILEFHGNIAFSLRETNAKISRTELARQFEFARLYDECYEVIKTELEIAELQSAHSYQKQLLIHLLEIPLSSITINEIKFKLCKVLSKLNDHSALLKLIDELDSGKLSMESLKETHLLKAKALYGTGELANAREILYRELEDTSIGTEKIKISIDIAYIDFDLSNYDKSKQLCEEIVKNEISDYESKGRCYNLLGLIEQTQNNDVQYALQNFNDALKMYELSGQTLNKLKIEINIGNTYFVMGNVQLAEEYWNKALITNEIVGNLEFEAMIVMNLGALNFDQGKYSEAEENFLKARTVFITTGNKLDYCALLLNLSETYIDICSFDKANICLIESSNTLSQMNNYELEADTTYTLGKFYYYLGDYDALDITITKYEKIINKVVLSDRYYNNLNSIKLLKRLNSSDIGLQEEFKKVINNFLEFDDKYNYLKFSFIMINYLITHKYDKEALDELTNDSLINSCRENMIHEAERLYLLGTLSDALNNKSLAPSNYYFDKAYEIIENQSITDLTWKILFALAGYYKYRGNDSKFYEYLSYSKSVLNFLIQQIKNVNLRSKYLNKQERKSVLKQIDKWESNT